METGEFRILRWLDAMSVHGSNFLFLRSTFNGRALPRRCSALALQTLFLISASGGMCVFVGAARNCAAGLRGTWSIQAHPANDDDIKVAGVVSSISSVTAFA